MSHLFFVDDLKTYAQDSQEAKLEFDLTTIFTNDIKRNLVAINVPTFTLK